MALGPSPFFVGATQDGAPQHSADKVRQVLNASAGTGVGSSGALLPHAISTPTSRIVLEAGPIIIEGKAALYQGRYADFNDASLAVDIPPNLTAATVRHMVVIRVEDPNFEGSRNVMRDPIIFAQVISNVPAGADTLEDVGRAGWSAEPIALVTLPPNTSAVTNAMITDLRRLANPKSHVGMWASHPDRPYNNPTGTGWKEFWTVSHGALVPAWASRWNLVGMMGGLVITGNWQGDLRVVLRDTVDPSRAVATEHISIVNDGTTGDRRFSEPIMDLREMPANLRGRRVRITFETAWFQGTGRMTINQQTTIAANITFLESLR